MKLMRSVYCFDTVEILTSILCFNYSSNMEQLSSEALYSSEGKKFYNINNDNRRHIISLKYFSTMELLFYSRRICYKYVESENIILQVSSFVFHVTDNTAA